MTIRRRACVLGATLYAAPTHASRVVGYISAGQEIIGEDVEGEPVIGKREWIKVEGYLPIVRVIEVDDAPRKRMKKRFRGR